MAYHLKDILAKKPRTDAKADLYKLFDQLGEHFNGDLFSADLEAESRQIKVEHLEILDRFFHGTDVRSGQQASGPTILVSSRLKPSVRSTSTS